MPSNFRKDYKTVLMRWTRRFTALVTAVFIVLLSACGFEKKISYNNLVSDEDWSEFTEIADNQVPSEDLDCIMGYLDTYSNGGYARKYLKSGWKTAGLTTELYDTKTVINCFTEQEFADLNCRVTAFIVFHSFLKLQAESFSPNFSVDENWEKNLLPEYLLDSYDDFRTLFGSLPLEETVAETVEKYWQRCGIVFQGDSIHLVSLWAADDNKAENLHVGVLFRKNGNVLYFFEKTAPLHPFQLTRFDTVEDVKDYLLHYTDEYADKTVFFDAESMMQ